MLNVNKIKKDFPILQRKVNGKRLIYLDSAATSQKPTSVIQAEIEFYRTTNANIHRGIHSLSEEATRQYEQARHTVQKFIGASFAEEIIFTRNTTEAINAISLSWGMANVGAGDEILLTELEHHANLIPWQRVAKANRATLKFIPVNSHGELDIEQLDKLITTKTKLVAMSHVSNVLGSINPVHKIIHAAHKVGAVTVVDAAQSIPHLPLDVTLLDADFIAFSGHKMLAPTGIGVLYGKRELLRNMEPFLLGGEMIRDVNYYSATWHDLPWKFEAGTPNIAGAIGLAAAIEYLNKIGMPTIEQHDKMMMDVAMDALQQIDGLSILGPDSKSRSSVVAFNLEGIHAHDLATLLDEDGVAIRSGHHCAQPLLRKLEIPAVARASFYIYNDKSDVDALVASIKRAQRIFAK